MSEVSAAADEPVSDALSGGFREEGAIQTGGTTNLLRIFAWSIVLGTLVFLINNYLTNWRKWPGPFEFSGDNATLSMIQTGLFAVGLAVAVLYVLRTSDQGLRPDSERMYAFVRYMIRAAFWGVMFVGLADMVISFMRVEDLLKDAFGAQLASDLGRSSFRGTWIHIPLLLIGCVIAFFNRGLGFHWLALLVVIAELLIVITRFIFSYEQAFMGDLVRFWYAALFLFASAHTLYEDGHVRVDVVYASMSDKMKGLMNAIGAVLLGISLCGVILAMGMANQASTINAPLLVFETTQTGYGMYVKYLMAGFLAIFSVSMMIQFAGSFLESLADYRGEPGKREIAQASAH